MFTYSYMYKYSFLFVVEVVGPGTPPDGHVSGARLYSAGCAAANEEEPGKKT